MDDWIAESLVLVVGLIAFVEVYVVSRKASKKDWGQTKANFKIWMTNNVIRILAGNAMILGTLLYFQQFAVFDVPQGALYFLGLFIATDFLLSLIHI